jgi:hypothetical protein
MVNIGLSVAVVRATMAKHHRGVRKEMKLKVAKNEARK